MGRGAGEVGAGNASGVRDQARRVTPIRAARRRIPTVSTLTGRYDAEPCKRNESQ